MKVLISEFRQESNSLTPIRSDLQFWRKSGWVLDPGQVRDHLAQQNTAVAGMISAVEAHGSDVQLEFGPAWYSQSGGTAEQDVMDAYWRAFAPELDKHLPLDAGSPVLPRRPADHGVRRRGGRARPPGP